MSKHDVPKAGEINISPSDIVHMTEDEIGDVLRRIREQARLADTRKELDKLQELRSELNKRLDQFLNIDMESLDKHPDVSKVTAQLTQLTLAVKAEAQKIRDFTSAIEKGTKVLGYVDSFLKIVGTIAAFV
jgi:hypothetical protein